MQHTECVEQVHMREIKSLLCTYSSEYQHFVHCCYAILDQDQKNVLSSPGQCNEVDSVMDDTENHLATMYQCHKNRSPQPSCEKCKQGISHLMCMTPSQLGPS